MFRINKRNHRQHDREHGINKSISKEFFLVQENIKEKKKMKLILKQ